MGEGQGVRGGMESPTELEERVALSPLLLTFDAPHLEQKFQRRQIFNFYSYFDHTAVRLHAGLVVLFFPAICVLTGTPFHWSHAAYTLVSIANALTLAYVKGDTYVHYRHALVLAWRAVQDVIAVLGISNWGVSRNAADSPLRHWMHILITSGISAQIWGALVWPLPFKYHVSYSVFSAMAYSIKLTPIACDFLGTTASGVALTGQLWRVLAKGSSAVLQVGSWMGPWLLLMVEDLEKLPSGVSACYASTSIMRVLLAFALPTLAVYVMERASRRHFLQQSKVGIEVQAPMMSAIHRVAAAYVLLTSCFALWELSILVQELKTAV